MKAARVPRLWCARRGLLPLLASGPGDAVEAGERARWHASGLAPWARARERARMSSLWKLEVEIAVEQIGSVDDLLLELGEARWSVVEDVIVKRARLEGIFESEGDARDAWAVLEPQLPAAAKRGQPELRRLADEDWRDSYKAHFKAWHFGRLHWVPVWERESFRLPQGDAVLWLDPGLAFGTGNHETTRLCVERLVKLAERLPKEARVVDAGCGSGILALSAALLGFRDVVGFDNDAEAVRVSEENAVLNGLKGAVRFFIGDLVSGLQDHEAEVVLANIQADVLMRFRESLVGSVTRGGTLVLSGILATEQAQVMRAFAEVAPGWPVDGRVMGEWSDVVLTRPHE